MDELSIAPDALRDDAAWVRRFAGEVAETTWQAVELVGSDVASATPTTLPELELLATDLSAWAAATSAAADELVSADVRAGDGLVPR